MTAGFRIAGLYGDINLAVSELDCWLPALKEGLGGPWIGRRGSGKPKSGGSDMTPPISKKSRSLIF
jgi:hypothetical protein